MRDNSLSRTNLRKELPYGGARGNNASKLFRYFGQSRQRLLAPAPIWMPLPPVRAFVTLVLDATWDSRGGAESGYLTISAFDEQCYLTCLIGPACFAMARSLVTRMNPSVTA